jgi:hypothetical protein
MKVCITCKRFDVRFGKNKNTKDGLQQKCKLCYKEYNRNHYQINKEKKKRKSLDWYHSNLIKAKSTRKRWRENNIDAKRENDRLYYLNNSEKLKQYQKLYISLNKDRIAQRVKIYNKKNKDKMYATRLRWNNKNIDSVRMYKHNYKAKRKELEARSGWKITGKWWSSLLNKYGRRCAYCGIEENLAKMSKKKKIYLFLLKKIQRKKNTSMMLQHMVYVD